MATVAPLPRPTAEAVLSHSASRLVTLDELALIPAGEPAGTRHRPVPHADLVTAIRDAFMDRGYAVAKEQYSVSHEDARLFGTLDLMPTAGPALLDGMEGGMAVGLRHANDQAFALGVIAGLRVFVCDNLCFSGGDSLLHRKHTTGLDLGAEIERGMDRTFHSYRDFARLLDNLRNTVLTDDAARLLIYSLALDASVIAPSQLGKVHTWYFAPERIAMENDRERGFSDVAPRTAHGVMNAVTRVTREFSPARQQDVGVALSNHLASYFRMPAFRPSDPHTN